MQGWENTTDPGGFYGQGTGEAGLPKVNMPAPQPHDCFAGPSLQNPLISTHATFVPAAATQGIHAIQAQGEQSGRGAAQAQD